MDITFKNKKERETGIEPATPSLARRCSTAEPLAHNWYESISQPCYMVSHFLYDVKQKAKLLV